MRITFEARFKAGIKHDLEANVYVAYAPALQIFSQGTSRPRARQALESAVKLFLAVAYDKGVLGKILHDCGFAPVAADPAGIQPGDEYVTVQEETVLEEMSFDDYFEVTAPLELARAA
jgi:hypothetical protein